MTTPPADSTADTAPDPETESSEQALVAFAEGVERSGLVTHLIDVHGQKLLVDLLVEELGGHRVLIAFTVRLLIAPAVKTAGRIESALLTSITTAAHKLIRKAPVVRNILAKLNTLADRLAALADDKIAKTQAEQAFAAYLKGTRPSLDADTLDLLSADLQADDRQLRLLKDIQDLLEALPDRLIGQPPLTSKVRPDAGDRARFVFTARRSTFVGRKDTLAALRDFLETDAALSWWLVTGPGGMGKSRLAQEALLANGDWRMGFLDADVWDMARWSQWTPSRDTCLIIDYAARAPDTLRRLLVTLHDRATTFPPGVRVRVLLLERTANEDEPWWKTFQGPASGDGPTVHALRQNAPLTLAAPGADDLWHVMEERWRQSETPPPDRTTALNALAALDPEGRPLFALILADAFAHDGASAWTLTKDDALRGVLTREQKQFWPQNRSDPLDNLFCLATMTGGLGPEAWASTHSAAPDLLPAPSQATANDAIRMAAGQDPSEDHLPALHPDILGELAVLDLLKGRFDADRRRSLTKQAWAVDDEETWAFLDRCMADFPDHPALPNLLARPEEVPPDILTGWMVNVVNACSPAFRLPQAVVDALFKQASSVDISARPPVFRWLWANAAMNWITVFAQDRPDETHAILDHMRTMAEHPKKPALREVWARAAYNWITSVTQKRPDETHVLLGVLQDIAQTHTEEPILRKRWAKAAYNWITDITQHRPDETRLLLGVLHAMAQAHPEDPTLREVWANAAMNWIADIAQDRPDDTRILLDGMQIMAHTHAKEPALREAWAKAAMNWIGRVAQYRPDETSIVLDGMRTMAQTHTKESTLRELWAKAATNWMTDLIQDRPDETRAVLDNMLTMAQTHTEEPALREVWVNAAFNWITILARNRSDETRSLLNAMQTMAQAHPEEPTLREKWVTAVVNWIGHVAQDRSEETRGLLEAMRTMAQTYTEEPILREKWAKAAFNWITNVAQERPDETLSLLEAMQDMAQIHTKEPALRGKWANATTNWIAKLAQDRFAETRSLLNELYTTTQKHSDEPVLRERLANAATLAILLMTRAGNQETAPDWCREMGPRITPEGLPQDSIHRIARAWAEILVRAARTEDEETTGIAADVFLRFAPHALDDTDVRALYEDLPQALSSLPTPR